MKQCAKGERAWEEGPLGEEGGREGERYLSPLDMLGKFATAGREQGEMEKENIITASPLQLTHNNYIHTHYTYCIYN